MKLYRVKIPAIAHDVIDRLCAAGDIEVDPKNREEAEHDLRAIMEFFNQQDQELREDVREYMANHAVPYDQYGSTRNKLAESRNHPTGEDIDRFLARQFVENFMISNFVEEVFSEDREIYKRILEILRSHDVDERGLREEARDKVKNIGEGTVEYEIALSRALKEVKKRHGLLQ